MYSRKKQDFNVFVNVEDGSQLPGRHVSQTGFLPWINDNLGILPLLSGLIFIGSLVAVALCLPMIGHAMGNAGRGRYSYPPLNVNKTTNLTKPIRNPAMNLTRSRFISTTTASPTTVANADIDVEMQDQNDQNLQFLNHDENLKIFPAEIVQQDQEEHTEYGINVTTVGFLLPLRGSHRALGFTFGRPLKNKISEMFSRNETNIKVLVRDTNAEPNWSKDLTKHFYDSHGTRKFFGYITDDEALSVSEWGRSHAPGAKFISPSATSHFLEKSRNFVSVQPESKYLIAAISDFFSLTSISNDVIIISPASISKDSFIDQLKMHKVNPRKIIYYYHWNDIEYVSDILKPHVINCPYCPIMLLGDMDSCVELIKRCDISFQVKPTWILPLSTQLYIVSETLGSNIVSIRYRPYDYVDNGFLQPDYALNALNSTLNASLHLLLGGKKFWKGSFVVALHTSNASRPDSFSPMPQLDGGVPLIAYEINDRGIVRSYYEHLALSTEALKNLTQTQNEECELVIRYMEELSGEIRVVNINTFSTVLLPVSKGAQVHLDCPNQHVDVKCRKAEANDVSISCNGQLYGNHNLSPCGKDVEVTLETFRGCSIAKLEGCKKTSKPLICRISNLCSYDLRTKGAVSCNGVVINELKASIPIM